MATPTVFLVNPASANGSTGRRWPELARRAAAAGLEGDTLLSERQGHLSQLAREAALGGARLLVVVGGDGSVVRGRERARGVADPPEIAIVPRGTGWDFVRTFGIPRDVERATAIALEGETRTIDAGRVTYRAWDGCEATAIFANVGSAGMSGAIAKRAQRDDEGARREGVLPVGDVRRLRALAGGRGRARRR